MPRAKIMVSDDDVDVAEAISLALQSADYEVVVASSGKETLEKLPSEKPDLLILDVMMEDKRAGFSVSQKMRTDPELAGIPILMLTAVHRQTPLRFSPDTDEEYLPVEEFIEKPIDPKRLLERIEKLLKL